MNIIHISAECYPVAKVGGLADVVGSLPKYQNKLGMNSAVVMPFYDLPFTQNNKFKSIHKGKIQLGAKTLAFKILTPVKNDLEFDLFMVDIPELLYKTYVYSNDDTHRFLAFQIAALDWLKELKEKPDIIHCHDHHTGLVPFMMSYSVQYKSFRRIPSVFTIHNAQYQGWFSHDEVHLIPSFDLAKIGLLDWDNVINPLATAIKCAWRVTTVSETYLEELKEEANGLQDLIRDEGAKCSGILNGIDSHVWNPETDAYIVKNYNERIVQSGKKANKAWLCKTYSLDTKKPLIVFIGRLVGEKGADLFPKVFDLALKSAKISILLLGSGNEAVEEELIELKDSHPGFYNAYIGYDEALSHKMYAGADFLLMPSRVEPCGLNQLYSLRYGTIPIVSAVGGLKDTVTDINDGGFGICHNEISVEAIHKAIQRATAFYKDQQSFRKTRQYIMKIDHSWDVSAAQYIDLYESLIKET